MDSSLLTQYSGLFFVAGFLLVAHAHNRKNYIKNILKSGIKREGTVIQLRQNRGPLFSRHSGQGFAPVVKYSTASGKEVLHYSPTFRSPPRYAVDQKVSVYYREYRTQRESALFDDEPGTLPRKLFLVGLALLLLALPQMFHGLSGLFNATP